MATLNESRPSTVAANERPSLEDRSSSNDRNTVAEDENCFERKDMKEKEGEHYTRHRETAGSSIVDPAVANVNAKLANPLDGIPKQTLMNDAAIYADEHGLGEYRDLIARAALVAQNPLGFDSMPELSEQEKADLRKEQTHKWWQTRELYSMVVLCSLAAAVQGMDEAVINGAQLFYPDQFGLSTASTDPNAAQNQWLVGLVNSAPYLCCCVLGCWLTYPLNRWFGRRGAIFISALLSFLTCIWQGVTDSWPHLFAARFVLGLGIGPKSATVPVYAAESAPAPIRGALVMMWQMWTAFGIMLGYCSDLWFLDVKDTKNITGLNWRLMLGSAGIPAIVVFTQVYFCPESPRWLMERGRHADAFKSLLRLRKAEIHAARDLYYIHRLLEIEQDISRSRNLVKELFTVPRNRRATIACSIVMFMQQFCGVNVIAYYSSSVFTDAGFSNKDAFLSSWGFGMLNWLFAIPGFYTIDTFGRRNLLLVTFPLMAGCLLLTGFAFYIKADGGRVALVSLGIYLFAMVYSPGEGPVPFTYSAEAFPLYIREMGMSLATAVCWGFNFVISITWPRMLAAFSAQGAFGWYAGWNVIGWFGVLFFVYETKNLSLEELDQVFSVPTKKHAAYGLRQLSYVHKRYVLRQNVKPEKLYDFQDDTYRNYDHPYMSNEETGK